MNKDDYCPICDHHFCICPDNTTQVEIKHKCVNFVYKEKGPHIGKYCKDCGKWIKWVPKALKEQSELKEPSPYDGDYYEDDCLPWEEE